ncbi:AMP-activated serine/threonine-protein kinase regulatory subunit [Lunasporangiospora selenospora]|uniref:AMP-activated serine/threonine-protein kinase regulatory subunit n=1 Tax=Lunasporangiospora selenospora TaxID=979761 RepID=A0A9P6KHB8_9FUNG|nr:AMP-activated serine/threonine-protein kinase regulatory subunit [Lunasporangiospora selenospora]
MSGVDGAGQVDMATNVPQQASGQMAASSTSHTNATPEVEKELGNTKERVSVGSPPSLLATNSRGGDAVARMTARETEYPPRSHSVPAGVGIEAHGSAPDSNALTPIPSSTLSEPLPKGITPAVSMAMSDILLNPHQSAATPSNRSVSTPSRSEQSSPMSISSSSSQLPKTGETLGSTPMTRPGGKVQVTETIDPVASYSAWRKKRDNESEQGTQTLMESFLKQHSAYDVLPVSYRQIVLDTTLLVKKALSVLIQYNVVSAPLWDSTNRKFAGMLTATDFINLIQFYYQHSSYSAAIREMDQFQISQLRDVEKLIGVPPPELFSLHPLQSLYDACQLLVESRAHRLPLVDMDSESGEEMIVSCLTQYRILKFIAMNFPDEKALRQPLSELKIGVYMDLAVADLSTPVMEVINMFVKRKISSVPIVDEEGVVLNVFETVDVMSLVKPGAYRDLDLCVADALHRRPDDFAGVHTCTLNDSLSSIFGTIRKSQVHRLIVVDGDNKLQGIVSLSDIMRYLIGNCPSSEGEQEGDIITQEMLQQQEQHQEQPQGQQQGQLPRQNDVDVTMADASNDQPAATAAETEKVEQSNDEVR